MAKWLIQAGRTFGVFGIRGNRAQYIAVQASGSRLATRWFRWRKALARWTRTASGRTGLHGLRPLTLHYYIDRLTRSREQATRKHRVREIAIKCKLF